MKYRVNSNASKVSVTAKTTLHDVKGSCPGLAGEIWGDLADLTKTAGASLKLDLRRFSSGDRIRDFAMRTHIDIAKHPEAELSDLKILKTEGDIKDMKILWEGTLKYRFKAPKIQGEARLSSQGDRLSIDVSFPLTLKDVNVDPPKFLFLKVGDTVKVEVRIEALLPA